MLDLLPASGQLEPRAVAVEEFGVVPWGCNRKGDIRVLLVTARGKTRWTVPKGRLMAETSPMETAGREAFNEAGAVGRLDPTPLGRFAYRRASEDDQGQWHAATLYSFRVTGTLLNWPEKAERRRRWFELDSALAAIDDRNLRTLLTHAGFVDRSLSSAAVSKRP